MSRMFPFITKTWNPLGGKCRYGCTYCWAKKFAERRKMAKYQAFSPYLVWQELERYFKADDFVFVCDMCDLFGQWVPSHMIQKILDFIKKSPAQFLLLTKNPERYLEFSLPVNCVAGATIETDIDAYIKSNAPTALNRINAMIRIPKAQKMISIEPISKFSKNFTDYIIRISPEFVAVGYDNYHNNLEEPSLAETENLIKTLKDSGIKVYRKTIRERTVI